MPKYLIDRSLGGRDLQEVLRNRGEVADRVVDFFPHDDETGVNDVEWLAFAGQNGYAVLSKDKRMRRLSKERTVICEHSLLVFCVTNQQIPGPEIVSRFLSNWPRIAEIAENATTPSFYGVHSRGVEPLELDCDSA
jgi:hypothetical protein